MLPNIHTWAKVYIHWRTNILLNDMIEISYCSPQVYNILKDNINSPFLEFYKTHGTVAYDKNKQYKYSKKL